MFVYIFISLILTGLAIINPKNKMLKKSIYLLLGIFLCTSYFNGSDWRSYELMYELANLEDIKTFYAEKGFYVYMCIFKILGFNFFEFFIITKFIIYYIFYKLLIKSPNFYLILNIFYYQMALFLFIDCPLRNLIAIGLVLLGIEQWNKRKKIGLYIYIILAMTFHVSAIFFIILPLIYTFNKLSKKTLIIIMLIIYIILSSQNILLNLIKYLPFFEERLLKFIGRPEGVGEFFSLGNIEKIIVCISLILLRDKYKYYKKELGLIVGYFILYRIAVSFLILGRLTLYIQIFYIFGIGLLIENLKNRLKIVVILLIGLYSITNIYKVTSKTYKYIPYTNYLVYIGKEKPSYEYRKKYNYIEYIKRNGVDEFIKKYINK